MPEYCSGKWVEPYYTSVGPAVTLLPWPAGGGPSDMPDDDVLWVDSQNYLQVRGLRDRVQEAWLANADVMLTLLNADDVPVPGIAWPIFLTYVSGSDGDYVGPVPREVVLEHGRFYKAVIVADAGGGLSQTWRRSVSAKWRT